MAKGSGPAAPWPSFSVLRTRAAPWNATTLRTAVLKVEPNPFGGFDLRQSDGKLVLVPFVVEPLRQARPEELHERRLGPRLLAALEARQRAAVHEAHELDLDPPPRDLLPNDGIAAASL